MGTALIKGIGMGLSQAGEDMSQRLREERIMQYRQQEKADDRVYQSQQKADDRAFQEETMGAEREYQAGQKAEDRAYQEKMTAPQRGLIQSQLAEKQELDRLLTAYEQESDPGKRKEIGEAILLRHGKAPASLSPTSGRPVKPYTFKTVTDEDELGGKKQRTEVWNSFTGERKEQPAPENDPLGIRNLLESGGPPLR